MNIFEQKGHAPIETIDDPRTGEKIHRVAIDQKLIDEVDGTIKKHQETMNAFVMNSQNFFAGMKVQLELTDKIKIADDAIKSTLTAVQKKAKLDPKKPWAYNLHLKTFEYRVPPVVQGMTDAEIKSANESGLNPIKVASSKGIGV